MSKDIFPGNDERFEGIDAYVEAVIDQLKVPGMAVAVVEEDQVIFSKGYGKRSIADDLPVDSETVFAIGSSSKAFTTMAMGILVDQGKLEWDTPLREYLPTFKLHDPFATERMTPRDLVCHRSGLPRHDLMWYNSPLSRKEIYDRIRYLEPNKDFRTNWQYQNLMYLTAGVLVEEVSGLTWEDFTQKEVFDCMAMSRSNFSVEKTKGMDNYALPYREEDDALKEIPFRNIDAVGPAGSINSCLADMVKWVELHLNGKVGDVDVIAQTQLNEMHSPAMVMPSGFGGLGEIKELSQGTYGLGWFIQYCRGRKLVHHGGNIDGFSALVSFLPDEKKGIVVLTNKDGTSAPMATILHIYDCLLGIEPPDWLERFVEMREKMKEAMEKGKEKAEAKKVPDTNPSHGMEDYVGEYEHPAYGVFSIELEDDQLIGTINNLVLQMEHYHYDIFEGVIAEMRDMRLPVQFHTDHQGNIAKLSSALEPNVKDIEFVRLPDKSMQDKGFLEQFVGTYELDGKPGEVLLKGDDTLVISLPGSTEMELVPYQGTEFKVKGIAVVSIEFVLDESGAVSGLDLSQPGMVMHIKKVA